MFRKILVAVDVTETDIAPPAIAAALEALDSGGEIRLVTVRAPLPVTRMDFIPAEFFGEQEKLTLSILEEIAAKVEGMKDRISVASRFGSVSSEVLAEAREWGADLIVVSAHQPTMATYLLGSNATKIVRHAECTVLVERSAKKQSLFE